ncbi:hypothetical protein L332_04920 [Agrococcus pavilionensis RW1]|uniref:Uncharacterized protein n=1 Tax=Agrococcus pavilionensis RW1 TaxID=1330458 RepID=U1MT26_9MICO|nr:hypothetical protein [Agrococcus pavilionensis]ERG63795.1 hypothetical protein L332_04920 [Agrococcus pavilionensis RW1]
MEDADFAVPALIDEQSMSDLMARARETSWPAALEAAAKRWYADGARDAYNSIESDGAFDQLPDEWIVATFKDAGV